MVMLNNKHKRDFAPKSMYAKFGQNRFKSYRGNTHKQPFVLFSQSKNISLPYPKVKTKCTYLENSALANASLILQPPENSFVFRCCISVVKPSPAKMTEARAGALSDSIAVSWLQTSVSSLFSSGSAFLELTEKTNLNTFSIQLYSINCTSRFMSSHRLLS